eukprot:5054275-Pleurochrysis_carterae.AAC.1
MRVAVRGDKLLVVLGPLQRANLRVRVDSVKARASVGVPEADHPIGRAAARREQVSLPRAPRERLDGGLVLVEAEERLVADAVRGRGVTVIPNVQNVVVAARSQLVARRGPLEAAHLLHVPTQRANLVFRHAHVVVNHHRVATTAREDGTVPRQ